MTQEELEKHFNHLNDIYYKLYDAYITEKITIIEWNNIKVAIWELKDKLQKIKLACTQTK